MLLFISRTIVNSVRQVSLTIIKCRYMGFWEQDYLLSEIWILQKKFSRSHRARHDKCLPIRIKKLILLQKLSEPDNFNFKEYFF